MQKLKKLSTPRLLLRRVVGHSMVPTLHHGQLVLAVTARRIKPGMVVIIRHHNLEKIKRVHQVQSGRVFVLGDNAAESTDSRQLGWLPQQVVTGLVIWPRTHAKVQSLEMPIPLPER